MQKKQERVDHYTVTQAMGFKPILHCWCGEQFDLNKNGRKQLRAFQQEHEGCEMPLVSKQAASCLSAR